jgi:hypothetical protein
MTYLVRVPPMLGAAVLATIGVPLYALLGAAGEQEDFVRSSPHNSRGCLACSVVPKLTFWGGNLFPLGYNSSPVRQWTLQGHFPAGRLLHAGGKCASGGALCHQAGCKLGLGSPSETGDVPVFLIICWNELVAEIGDANLLAASAHIYLCCALRTGSFPEPVHDVSSEAGYRL